jgi:ABC-type nickel/cobalt efflux system permease component RcnA
MSEFMDNWSVSMLAGVVVYMAAIVVLFATKSISYGTVVWLAFAPVFLLLGGLLMVLLWSGIRSERREAAERRHRR